MNFHRRMKMLEGDATRTHPPRDDRPYDFSRLSNSELRWLRDLAQRPTDTNRIDLKNLTDEELAELERILAKATSPAT